MQPDFLRGIAGMATQRLHNRRVLLHIVAEEVLGHAGTQCLGIGEIVIHRGAGLCRVDRAGAAADGLFDRDLQGFQPYEIGGMSVRWMRQAGRHFLLGQGQRLRGQFLHQAAWQIAGTHVFGTGVGRSGHMGRYPLLQQGVDGRDAHQGRSDGDIPCQLRARRVRRQLPHAAPMVHRVIETLHEILTEHERRPQRRALQHIALQHGFGNHPEAAADALVDRYEAQAVLGIGTGEVRQFVTDDRAGLRRIEQAQVQHRHVQCAALERGVCREQVDVA
ncbi:hypothetical protein D3C85_809600 [compost metagenome]